MFAQHIYSPFKPIKNYESVPKSISSVSINGLVMMAVCSSNLLCHLSLCGTNTLLQQLDRIMGLIQHIYDFA